MKLSGKIALVTGSGGEGSGRAEAVRLASEGCCVLVSDINDSGGNETVRRITMSGGKAASRIVKKLVPVTALSNDSLLSARR